MATSIQNDQQLSNDSKKSARNIYTVKTNELRTLLSNERVPTRQAQRPTPLYIERRYT